MEPDDIEPGMILKWSGSILSIPTGYALCDGTNGTPDLRDKFIRGAGGADSPNDIGGADIHNHDFTGDGHTHNLAGGAEIPWPGGGARDAFFNSQQATGTTGNGSTVPAYYALAYVMRL